MAMVRDFRDKDIVWIIRLFNGETSTLYNINFANSRKSPNLGGKILIAVNIGANSKTIQGFKEKFNDLNTLLSTHNVILLAVRGSDDNKELFIDKNWDALSNIKLVEDYTILRLPDDRDTLVVGGDVTLYRNWKKKHGKYFEDEEPVFDHTMVKSAHELQFCINSIILGFNIDEMPGDPLTMLEVDRLTCDKLIELMCSAQKMFLNLLVKGHNIIRAYIPDQIGFLTPWGQQTKRSRPALVYNGTNNMRALKTLTY